MFIVIAFIFLGIGLGYTVRTRLAAQARAKAVGTWTARATTWLIWLLLFMLGAEVGGNEQILAALPTLGVEALLLAVCSVLGCCVLAWTLWKSVKGGRA